MNKIAVVVLAAGQGKRMNNPNLPKVLAELRNTPLIKHVCDTANELNPEKIVLIVGHHKEMVIDYINSLNQSNIEFAIQSEQKGTGHAVDMTRELLEHFDGDIIILSGDVPLLRAETLNKFIAEHLNSGSDVSVLSAIADNPFGYGRIIRDAANNFTNIVEEKDSNPEQKLVKEINSGIYIVASQDLFDALSKVSNNNAQGEYYLTDIIHILRNQGKKTAAFSLADFDELKGVNSPEQLAELDAIFEKYKF